MLKKSISLYEINQAIIDAVDSCLDPETGEMTGTEALEALMMQRTDKLENYALYIKNLDAQAKAIRAEELELAKRRQQHEKLADKLVGVLGAELDGQKFETARVAISWRRSEQVLVHDEDQLPEDCLRFVKPQPDKTAIKKLLKAGIELKGAELVEKLNMQIK